MKKIENLKQNQHMPLRMCMSCRRRAGKENLFRLVKSPQRKLILDETGKMQARGYYLCRDEICLNRYAASKNKKFRLADGVLEEMVSDLLADNN